MLKLLQLLTLQDGFMIKDGIDVELLKEVKEVKTCKTGQSM